MVGKRTRPRRDSEDSDIEVASSSLRHDNDGRKRTRLTPVRGDSDDEESVVSSARPSQRTHENEDEDSDLDDDQVMARVAALAGLQDQGHGRVAENGIIEEVSCKNFMCHANLTVKLGPRINFIIGHNGSGKSAVLTALTICLGGKATATNRGQNLKAFIKAGAEQCTLSVKIKNQGETAYEPQTYGESIIVERVFSRSGTSGFKIKRADGHVQSTRKSDLEDILDALALMMDNPMNVLTQDMARQFLNSSNAAEKYKFFYQGTHLEQLDSDYRILAESLQQNQDQIYNLEKSAQAAKNNYIEAEKKAELAERHATMLDKYNELRRQMAWIQVQIEEEKLAEMEQQIRDQDDVIEERRAAFAEYDADMERYNGLRDAAKAAVDAAKADKATKAEERDSVKEIFDENRSKLSDNQYEERTIVSKLKLSKKEFENKQAEVEREKEKIASADDGRHAVKMDQIQAAEEKLSSLQEQMQQKSAESRPLDVAVRTAEESEKVSNHAVEASNTNIRSTEARIASIQRAQGDWREAFLKVRELQALLNLIDQERGFKVKPIGPIGRHIKLLEEHKQWADILETSSGATLDGFVCASKADQSILSGLMKRSRYQARIFMVPTGPLDTSNKEPAEKYLTWMRALRIDNVLVRNCMILNHGFEQTVLEEDSEKASHMISEGIANVLRIYAHQGRGENGEKWGRSYSLTTSKQEASGPINPWKRGARMQRDTGSEISTVKDQLAQHRAQHQALEASHRETQNDVVKARQAVMKHKRDMKALERSIQQQDVAITDLKNELDEETPQEQALERLEAELEDNKESYQLDQNAYQDCIAEKDKLNEAQQPIKARLNAAQAEVNEADGLIKEAETKLENAEKTRRQKLLLTNQKEEQVKDAEKQKERLERSHEAQAVILRDFEGEAEKVSSRVPIDAGETMDTLDAKLKRMHREQAIRDRELGGDKDTLILKKLEAKKYYDDAQRGYDNHNAILITLKRALENREMRWKKFRDYIVLRAQGWFTLLLQNRNFGGKLKIDHDNKLLDISVQPDAAQKNRDGRQTKTLSGGEKSFSTICLLLALWEAMGSPVRCLDEFDVFMDQVNRDISMRMMIEAARSSTQRQFVLITPQSMNNVQIRDDVKIHKMSDPERGQTTLSQFVR